LALAGDSTMRRFLAMSRQKFTGGRAAPYI